MKKSTTIVLFGATGDLAKRKIIPALYKLVEKKKLENYLIIGVAFDDVTGEQMINDAVSFVPESNETMWATLRAHSYYKKTDFSQKADFDELNAFVCAREADYSFINPNRLFYLATSAHFFCPITNYLGQTGLAKRPARRSLDEGGKLATDSEWHRVVYEKPFGHNKSSANQINICIREWLNEEQIYRIDHYLTKEVVSNIAMIRFTNLIFEPLWSNKYIDHVQIILSEAIGIQNRGSYYDEFGALKDVVQNHMLELLALVCMEMPEKLTGECIRHERMKVLQKTRFADGILGQYAGYTHEKYVPEDSTTETFASLQLYVDTPRWTGVPFYLKTGKCLNKKETVIHIKFKKVDCLLTKGCPTDSNWLTIQIAPDAVFTLTLNVKRPEVMDEVVPVGMEFCHSCIFGVQTPEAYEVLFTEIMRGEQSISVRSDEIEYAWDCIDAIESAQLPVFTYEKGSMGPQEEQEWTNKHGIRWRS
jgi:glucose-6-phosphate 1-dehydrogenase